LDVMTYKALVACSRSLSVALLCGAVLSACGDGTGNASTADASLNSTAARKSEKSTVMVKATDTVPAPIATLKTWNLNATTSGNGSPPASAIRADSITLSWAAPTENTDGSALTDLSGYEIHYGTTATQLTQKISIGTVGISNYVVENLGSGTWYFEVVAVNTIGVESAPSSMVSITI
jgi:hypothetical protein